MRARFFTQFSTTPDDSLATARRVLREAVETGLPSLHVSSYSHDVILLGRYHAPDGVTDAANLTLARRLTGGRVFPAGPGFVQFALALPHRSFLLSDRPHQLAAFQVLNRYVRGVMRGLQEHGVKVFYPGRDILSVRRRAVGWLSFVTTPAGALLCEGGLFLQRDLRLLPEWLERTDPHGTIPCGLFTPEQVTTLEEVLGTPPAPARLARMLRDGFAAQFDMHFFDRDLDAAEQTAMHAAADRLDPQAWLRHRGLRTELAWQAVRSTPLGQLRVRFSLTPADTIREIQFSGDFLADPLGLKKLELGLRGCPLEKNALWRVIDNTLLDPDHYFLGAGKLEELPDLIGSAHRLASGGGPCGDV